MNAPAQTFASRSQWQLIGAAALILLLTTGSRQSLGLFVAPIDASTGLGIAQISLALAVGQLIWGASQPVFGAIADRYGPGPVLLAGGVLLALGFGMAPYVHTAAGLVASLGLLSAAGAGAGSFSVLMAAAARELAPQLRAFAAGLINAGASLGQFLFAPLDQALIGLLGWTSAMGAMALIMLAIIPLALGIGRAVPAEHAGAAQGPGLRLQLRQAAGNPDYWCLHAGFFTCGFHLAFLVTHLPTEINLCGLRSGVAATSLAIIGLANIAGSLGAGYLGNRVRMKWLLFWTYLTRALAIGVYLFAPRTALTFYVFAAVLGITWLSTVPSTAGLVGKLFGTRYLATLFGLTMLSHQIGGFLGAWLGGLAMGRFGNYSWMWYADILLAVGAALVNLPIREARITRVSVKSDS